MPLLLVRNGASAKEEDCLEIDGSATREREKPYVCWRPRWCQLETNRLTVWKPEEQRKSQDRAPAKCQSGGRRS